MIARSLYLLCSRFRCFRGPDVRLHHGTGYEKVVSASTLAHLVSHNKFVLREGFGASNASQGRYFFYSSSEESAPVLSLLG